MHAKAVAFGVPSAPRECSVTTKATTWEEQIEPFRSLILTPVSFVGPF